MNSEYLEWLELLGNAERRRCWLLLKALECSPLDRAIDLARAADEFIAGERQIDVSIDPKTEAATPQPRRETTHAVSEAPLLPDRPASQQRPALALSPEQRERLLRRLAQGVAARLKPQRAADLVRSRFDPFAERLHEFCRRRGTPLDPKFADRAQLALVHRQRLAQRLQEHRPGLRQRE